MAKASNIFDLFRRIESERETAGGPITAIVAGLGNPGREYTFTRHNSGFLAIDYIAAHIGVSVDRAKFNALVREAALGGERVLLLKPQTYMNRSGDAVGAAASFYKLPPERVFVLCDDVSLPVGTVRIRAKGSSGGQKGLRSIIEALGTEEFPRIKLGVGDKPAPEWDLADWVLSTFDAHDRELMTAAFGRAYEALPLLLKGDFAAAQSRYNG